MIRFLYAISLIFSCLLPDASIGAQFEISDENRQWLDLTVYNHDLGIINDVREVKLPEGQVDVALTDIVMSIDARTAAVTAEGFTTVSQNYRFDLLNRRSLLERFVGRKLKYSRFLHHEGNYEKILREGILLSIEPEIVRFGDVIEIDPEGTISLPYLPDDLITEPTLFLQGNSTTSRSQALNLRYHASSFSWEADYTLTLGTGGRLDAWVTLLNQSNSDLAVDRLRLVAGEVNQVAPGIRASTARMMIEESMVADVPVSGGDYHLYEYPGGVTLLNGQTTRLSLFASDVEVIKEYRLVSGVERYAVEGLQSDSPGIWLTFANTGGQGPNRPMPAGVVRVYEKGDNADTFLGEAEVRHTPVDGDIEIMIGRSFDLTSNRTQTSFRRLGDRGSEMAYRVELANASDEDVTVIVDEKMFGDWQIVSESQTGQKIDAVTYRFNVKVKANSETSVSYRVISSW